MLLKIEFSHYCEVIGRASAMVMLAGMTVLLLAATAIDLLR